jgi:hypothetical protein
VTRWTVAAVLACLLASVPLGTGIARAEDGSLACSCRVCEPEACCTTPSGFAPLDQKCAGKCTTKRWTVKAHENCAPQQDCCKDAPRQHQ